MRELKRRVLRLRTARQHGILLRQHCHLDFARRLEVIFHLQIFIAQSFLARGQFVVRLADALFGELDVRDVPEHALQPHDLAACVEDRNLQHLDELIFAVLEFALLDLREWFARTHHALVIFLA